mmetsp:Transcript_4938/g.11725  ORF Transcript_4938/g.11725 Transcript_4938/m.11725 type:complete len:243 (-) Transcript_4938:406-1134(-)
MIHRLPDCGEQIAESLMILFIHTAVLNVNKLGRSIFHLFHLHERMDAVSHDLLLEHILLVQLTDETDIAKHLLLDFHTTELQISLLLGPFRFRQTVLASLILRHLFLPIDIDVLLVELILAFVQKRSPEAVLFDPVVDRLALAEEDVGHLLPNFFRLIFGEKDGVVLIALSPLLGAQSLDESASADLNVVQDELLITSFDWVGTVVRIQRSVDTFLRRIEGTDNFIVVGINIIGPPVDQVFR